MYRHEWQYPVIGVLLILFVASLNNYVVQIRLDQPSNTSNNFKLY